MPFKSRKQRAFLHAFKPEVAARFEAHHREGQPLPKRKRKRKRGSLARAAS